jgi:hypothetical protein
MYGSHDDAQIPACSTRGYKQYVSQDAVRLNAESKTFISSLVKSRVFLASGARTTSARVQAHSFEVRP